PAARITSGSEEEIRAGFAECVAAKVSQRWQEELVLQSYLFAGFPRALNAAREWRRSQPVAQPVGGLAGGTGERSTGQAFVEGPHEGYADVFDWRERGVGTCKTVYGKLYEKFRGNIRALSPALDE